MLTSTQIKALVAVVFCAGLIASGWISRGWYDDTHLLKQANSQMKNTLQVERQDQAKIQPVVVNHAVKQAAVASQGSAITKEIIRYVQAPRTACKPDSDWVRIHRETTRGVPATTTAASGADAAIKADGNAVSDVDVLMVDAENALRFKQNFEQCTALQDFVRATATP